MNGEHSQTTLKRGKPVKGYPTDQSNNKWEEEVAEGVLVCKNKYTHAERTSTPMLKERVQPCWKNKYTYAERTSTPMLKEQVHPCWKNEYTHAERTSTSMLKEQVHPSWKNEYTHAERKNKYIHAERTSTAMLKEQVHRAERTSTPMLKEQEHDNYNGEWLLHSVNLSADQKLNALAHTIHAHTHTHRCTHNLHL